MITQSLRSIFEIPAYALVNPVNTQGISGAGLALQFKERYPENHEAYAKACEAKLLQCGLLYLYDRKPLREPRFIINFPTKNKWRNKSKLVWIAEGLMRLKESAVTFNLETIAIPKIGCGLGGLPWSKVYDLILQEFDNLPKINLIISHYT